MPSVLVELEDLIMRRCGGACEVCANPLEGERSFGWALHHRRFRDRAPDQDTPQNILAVCGGSNVDRCHGLIHSGKAYAIERGWAISRHGKRDPALIPVLIGGRMVYLTADGQYSEDPP